MSSLWLRTHGRQVRQRDRPHTGEVDDVRDLAVGESSVILLHPPLPLEGVSAGMEKGCQQNGLADG